jgi:Na+/H+ antiporter NhaA
MQHSLYLPVALVVIPIFAMANAGIPFDYRSFGASLLHPVTQGVLLGLMPDKFIGITGASWLALRLGFVSLPTGVTHASYCRSCYHGRDRIHHVYLYIGTLFYRLP